jgi:hypothetical protein
MGKKHRSQRLNQMHGRLRALLLTVPHQYGLAVPFARAHAVTIHA